MDLSVTCECGLKTQVTPTMCGNSVACDCGKAIQIPRLSELRRNAGLTPVMVGVADKLQAMLVDGLLPAEVDCVSCGSPTNLYLTCEIECERMFAKKPSYASYFLQFLFAPVWILGATKREYDNPEVHGRELVVKTPIRICETCFSKINLNRETCIRFMLSNELYAKLLARYPNAMVVWETTLRRSNQAMDVRTGNGLETSGSDSHPSSS